MRSKTKTRKQRTRAAAIFLTAILGLSLTVVNLMSYSKEANAEYFCRTFQISCEEVLTPIPDPPRPSSSEKFLRALFLQYVDEDAQVEIYKSNMDDNDTTSLRAKGYDHLESQYIEAAQSLPGEHAVAFKSSQAIVENAGRVKELGFDLIEFNLEPGLSPDSDNNDVVGAMKRAAQATHQQGLEFRAIPSRSYTTEYGAQIALFVDYYHIQAQSLQDNGVDEYSGYVHKMISKLKDAKPDLIISVQVSTQRGNAPGLSLLDTLKKCTDSVMDVVDGVSVWYGNPDLQILKSYVVWYNDKY
jgi:hypothetical protein